MTSRTTGPASMKLLRFIRGYIKRTGFAPSYQEMAVAIGRGSKSGVHRLIGDLEQRDLITRAPGQPRRIAIVEHVVCPHCRRLIRHRGPQ